METEVFGFRIRRKKSVENANEVDGNLRKIVEIDIATE
jgi:hypothetical protein